MRYDSEEIFNQEFEKTFTKDIIDDLVYGLKQGYSTSGELHDPKRGSNNYTYGTGVYHHTCFELNNLAELSDDKIKILTNPSIFKREDDNIIMLKNSALFKMQIGDFLISNHRVGKSEKNPIESSFPNTSGSACPKQKKYNPNQTSFLGQLELELNVPFNLVLAHFGNLEDGLCAVYLCRPGLVENGKIKSWEFKKEIWIRTERITISDDIEYQKLQDEEIPRPKVNKKKKVG